MTARVVLSEEDVRAAVDAFASGWLTMGPRIQALEQQFSELAGVPHAIAVGSGTAALHLAALAAGLREGGSVVLSALAPPEAVVGVRAAGGRPLRADVAAIERPEVTPDAVRAAANDDTRAVVLSHLGGEPAEADGLRGLCETEGWLLIEDATEAMGARLSGGSLAGTIGDLGCFSFAPGRLVGAGEGGMVVARDPALAAKVRSLRSHAMTSVTWDRHRGHADSYDVVDIGFNWRMDEPRAALAASRLARLDELVAERRELAAALAPPAEGASPHHVAILDADHEALAARGLVVRRWPDAFAGVDAEAAPRADEARARTALVDVGAALGDGLQPDDLR